MNKTVKKIILKLGLIIVIYSAIKCLYAFGIVQKYDDFFLILLISWPFAYDLWVKYRKSKK